MKERMLPLVLKRHVHPYDYHSTIHKSQAQCPSVGQQWNMTQPCENKSHRLQTH